MKQGVLPEGGSCCLAHLEMEMSQMTQNNASILFRIKAVAFSSQTL